MREHIPSYQLHMGQRVFVVPRDATTPRGPGLGVISAGGMELIVSDYIFGCVQRGAVLAYEVETPADEQVAAVARPTAGNVADPVDVAAESSAQQVVNSDAEKLREQMPAPVAEPTAEKENV